MQLPQLPKLSAFIKPLADIEATIKSQIESVTGVKLPPAPAETLHMIMESFESGQPPALPLPGFAGAGGGGSTAATASVEVGQARVESVAANVPEQPAKTPPPAEYNEVRAQPVLRIY